ncbi:MAG: S8 family serine peptidase, partial [Halioglobus sp.]|nr:S8 family serine peptidase [Halioglobus sp.]
MSKTLIAARIALIGVLATLWPVTALSSDLSSLDTPIANILQRGGLEVREHRSVDKKKTSANPAQSFSSSKVTNGNGTGTEIAYQAQGLIIIFASDEAKQLSENNSPPPQKLIDLIAEISGEHITFSRAMSMGAFVFSLDTPLSRESLKPILERLRKHPLIELASPDGRADTSFVPNDTYFGRQWPLFGFNDYWPLGGEYVIGINAIDAWNITTGSSDVVIAVLDTGIVNANGFGPGRVLPGYDFISNPFSANDGDGRDANPADPGNYRRPGECSEDSVFRPSSWHGTHVAGTIGAPANNNAGIAGVDWRAKILP